MVCRICGCKVMTSSEGHAPSLEDLCSKLSCYKEAHPELFQEGVDILDKKVWWRDKALHGDN